MVKADIALELRGIDRILRSQLLLFLFEELKDALRGGGRRLHHRQHLAYLLNRL